MKGKIIENIKKSKGTILPLSGSIILHLILMLLSSNHHTLSNSKHFELTRLDQNQLKKIRNFGSKNSNINETKIQLSGLPVKSKKLDLSSLQIKPKENIETNKQKTDSRYIRKIPKHPSAINALSLNGKEVKSFLKEDHRQGGALASAMDINNQQFLRSNFSIKMELPKGVGLDELNPEEMIYYGFQRRALRSFISSFYKTLGDFQRSYPHINLETNNRKMTARVLFSKDGYVKAIKIIEYSNQEKAQEFFIDVLEGLSLPNPPQTLLDQKDQFAYYFSLILEG